MSLGVEGFFFIFFKVFFTDEALFHYIFLWCHIADLENGTICKFTYLHPVEKVKVVKYVNMYIQGGCKCFSIECLVILNESKEEF